MYRGISKNLRRYSVLREMEHNSPLLKCRLHAHMTSFQRVQYGKGEDKNNFTVEEPGKHYPSQVTKATINSDKSYSQYVHFI